MTVAELEKCVVRKRSEYDFLKTQLEKQAEQVENLELQIRDKIEARNIISEASRVTQKQFKDFVEQLVTLAIQSVFTEENYKFVVNWELQNNRTQINLMVQQGEKEPYDPEDEQGGALLDIISFALRIVLWVLEKPRSRNVFILDEPFRWTGGYTERVAHMMRDTSKELTLQIIMVTHDKKLKEIADRSWITERIRGGVSVVTMVDQLPIEEVKEKTVKRRKIIL